MSAADDAGGLEADGMTRRQLGKRVATGVAGAGAIGAGGSQVVPRYSPIGRANAAVGTLAVIGLVGVAYVAGVAHERYTSDSPDITGEKAFEDHLEIYTRAKEIAEVDDPPLLASLERDATGLKSKAREQAVIDIYHTVVEGGSRTEAETAATEAIEGVFAAPHIDIATRVNSVLSGTVQAAADAGQLLSVREDSENIRDANDIVISESSYTFMNGESFTVQYWSDSLTVHFDPFHIGDNTEYGRNHRLAVAEPDPADYDLENPDDYDLSPVSGRQPIVYNEDYRNLVEKINTSRDEVVAEVEDLLSTHYDGIEAGDLSISDMLAPSALDETMDNAETWGELALYFRQLGLAEAEAPGVVEIDASEYDEIEGDTVELRGKLGWSIPSDVQDTELPVGAEINPDAYPGELRMAAEWEENGETFADMVSMTNPFTITGTDAGGDVLAFEKRDVVTADTTPEEATKIYTENREANDTASELTVKVANEGSGGDSIGDQLADAIGEAVNAAAMVLLLVVGVVGVAFGLKQASGD